MISILLESLRFHLPAGASDIKPSSRQRGGIQQHNPFTQHPLTYWNIDMLSPIPTYIAVVRWELWSCRRRICSCPDGEIGLALDIRAGFLLNYSEMARGFLF